MTGSTIPTQWSESNPVEQRGRNPVGRLVRGETLRGKGAQGEDQQSGHRGEDPGRRQVASQGAFALATLDQRNQLTGDRGLALKEPGVEIGIPSEQAVAVTHADQRPDRPPERPDCVALIEIDRRQCPGALPGGVLLDLADQVIPAGEVAIESCPRQTGSGGDLAHAGSRLLREHLHCRVGNRLLVANRVGSTGMDLHLAGVRTVSGLGGPPA